MRTELSMLNPECVHWHMESTTSCVTFFSRNNRSNNRNVRVPVDPVFERGDGLLAAAHGQAYEFILSIQKKADHPGWFLRQPFLARGLSVRQNFSIVPRE
jgi:hypothetical protein